ncbi:Protein O-mannosyltransferase 2, partial [Coemansia sp. RSA 2320]
MSLFENAASSKRGSQRAREGGSATPKSPPPEYTEKHSLFASGDGDASGDETTLGRTASSGRGAAKSTGSSKAAPADKLLARGRQGAAVSPGSPWALGPAVVHMIALTVLSMATRFYNIGFSNRVIWDEAHHGGFGARYVNGTFYHDVHPPLAKMLVGLSEILTGFDGSFSFESGSQYPSHVNYKFMRLFNASFGVPLAPMAYATLANLGCSPNAALLGGLLVCFDNALCTISRFILLDAMHLCFTAMSALALSGMYKYRRQPFTAAWYRWLVATGVSLGLVASAKWVGFLTVGLVGLYTLYELYDVFGQRKTRVTSQILHWAARVVGLIVIPVAIYMLCFRVHFALLYKSGPGDAEMDSLFQANLQGSGLMSQPLDVAYGSKVTIKSAIPGAGLLHSHADAYPDGSKQQQITGYTHKDENNDWIVKKVHGQTFGNTSETVEFVKNGDVVRLVHERTTRNLHSHAVPAHVSKREWEVSG